MSQSTFPPLACMPRSCPACPLQTVSEAFSQLRRNGALEIAMPAVGGLFTGIVALRYPEVLYQGFGNVNAILQNKANYAPWLLLQILGMKIICTSVCRGSGLVGGIYAPSIFMGEFLIRC